MIRTRIERITRIMTEFEQLRRNTEKAYQAALNALFDLVNAITAERNYYRELCNQKEAQDETEST